MRGVEWEVWEGGVGWKGESEKRVEQCRFERPREASEAYVGLVGSKVVVAFQEGEATRGGEASEAHALAKGARG